MNTDDPTDLAPLPPGPGLTYGLFLLLGMPLSPRQPPHPSPARASVASPLTSHPKAKSTVRRFRAPNLH